MLLSLAQTDRERECIKYSIVKASGMTATRACCEYGFERMAEHTTRVEQAIVEAQKIHRTIEDIARIQDLHCWPALEFSQRAVEFRR